MDQERLERILEVLIEYTQKDFSKTIAIRPGDELDAIGMGINVIGEELGHYLAELNSAKNKLDSFINSTSMVFILFDAKFKLVESIIPVLPF